LSKPTSASLEGAGNASQHAELSDQIPEKYFNFLGLVIVRKADLLAAAAFLLAAGSAAYQAAEYLSGPHLEIFAPDNILVFFDRYSDGAKVTRIAGQLTFTNSGAAGRTGTVREAWVDLIGPNIAIQQYWNSFPKLARDKERLKIEDVEYAFPLEVPGQGTISKFTVFAPWVEPCPSGVTDCNPARQYVSDTAFLHRLAQHIRESVILTFHSTTFRSGKVAPSSCKLVITSELVINLGINDWYMGRCQP
jgi:hypothetical protein